MNGPYEAKPERSIKGIILSRQQIFFEGHHVFTIHRMSESNARTVALCMNKAYFAGKMQAQVEQRLETTEPPCTCCS